MDYTALHDATLQEIELRWTEGIIRINVIYWSGTRRHGAILGTGVFGASIPRAFPWGESQSINQVSLHEHNGKTVLSVEMQSGDELVIHAAAFSLEEGEAFYRDDDDTPDHG